MTATASAAAPLAPTSLPVRRDGVAASALTWLGLVAYLVLAKLLLDAFLPDAFADPSQRAAFAWPVVAGVAAAGLAGVWLMHRTGFPAALDARVSNRRRLLTPVLLGLGLGGLQIGIDLATGYTRLLTAAHGVAQQHTGVLPMLLIFTAAPVLVETVYRFLLIPAALWLVSGVLLRGRGQAPLFWGLAVLTSLWEPLEQTGRISGAGTVLFGVLVAQGFALNLAEATVWRRAGLLAPLALRTSFYVLWHVLYVH